MNRRGFVLAATLPLLLLGADSAEPGPLIGTWKLRAAEAGFLIGGERIAPYGTDPSGRLTLDSQGNYSFMVMDTDHPEKTWVHSGTYGVDEPRATVKFRIADSSRPGSNVEEWSFRVLADRLVMTTPIYPMDLFAYYTELEWARMRAASNLGADGVRGCYLVSFEDRAVGNLVPGGFPDTISLSPSLSAPYEYAEGEVFAHALPDSVVAAHSHKADVRDSLRNVARWMLDGSGDTLVLERWADVGTSLRMELRRVGTGFVGEWGKYVFNVKDGSGGDAALAPIECPA